MFRRDRGEGVPAASVRAQGRALMMALSYVDAYYVQITEHCNNLGTSTTYALRPCLCTFESICVCVTQILVKQCMALHMVMGIMQSSQCMMVNEHRSCSVMHNVNVADPTAHSANVADLPQL
jgi:hypothetical protein